jgi:hypothetical protein
VAPLEALIYMKLRARRRQDLLDVVGLINAGADVRRVRRYLERCGGDLVAVFDRLVEEALEGKRRHQRFRRRSQPYRHRPAPLSHAPGP